MKKYSYSVILQHNGTTSKPDENPFEMYKSFVENNIKSTLSDIQRFKTETIQKNGTILRGGLSPFLSTPLKTDTDEIIRLIEDSIENTVQQLDAAPILSSVEYSIWKVLDVNEVPLNRQIVGVVKRLLKNGRMMLSEAGCSFAKNSGDVAFSIFSFDGFSTVQPLKAIVDSFGRQQLLSVVNGSMTTTLTAIEQEAKEEKNLVVIDFDYADDSIVDLLNLKLNVLLDQFGIKYFTLSKHSLHSGIGLTYQMRFGLNASKYPLGSVILSLVGEHDELEDAITTHGSLIVLEQYP